VRPSDDDDEDEDTDDEEAADAEDDDAALMEVAEAEVTDDMEGHRLPCESTRYRRAMAGVSDASASR
jgi:hypothetical protein